MRNIPGCNASECARDNEEKGEHARQLDELWSADSSEWLGMMVTTELERSKASDEDGWDRVYIEERSDELKHTIEGKQSLRDRETGQDET